MKIISKRIAPKLKREVAFEAIKGEKTINEIAMNFKVHPRQVSQWKKQLQESVLEMFGGKKEKREKTEGHISQLYEEIGRLKFELDWLKKKSARFN